MKPKPKHYRVEKRFPIVWVVAVIIAVLLTVIIYFFIINNLETDQTNSQISTTKTNTTPKTQPSTEQTIAFSTEKESTAPTEPTTKKIRKDNEDFLSLIRNGGYDSKYITGKQLIVVNSNGTGARISFFEKKNGSWNYSDEIKTVDGFVGAQGVSENANENASYTPKGLFPLETAFGIYDNPGTSLDYFKITENSYWIDDVNSQYYNQHIEADPNEPAPKGEHLIDYKGYYDYAVFVGYNSSPAVAGKGSAFFLHIGYEPTAGCIAISEDYMYKTLLWLDKSKNPFIMIY